MSRGVTQGSLRNPLGLCRYSLRTALCWQVTYSSCLWGQLRSYLQLPASKPCVCVGVCVCAWVGGCACIRVSLTHLTNIGRARRRGMALVAQNAVSPAPPPALPLGGFVKAQDRIAQHSNSRPSELRAHSCTPKGELQFKPQLPSSHGGLGWPCPAELAAPGLPPFPTGAEVRLPDPRPPVLRDGVRQWW